MTDVILIFHFGLFFALLSLQQPEKSKILKNDAQFWRYGGRQTDGQTD